MVVYSENDQNRKVPLVCFTMHGHTTHGRRDSMVFVTTQVPKTTIRRLHNVGTTGDMHSLVVALRRFSTAFIKDAPIVHPYGAEPGSIQSYCYHHTGNLHHVHIRDSPSDHRLLVV